MGAALKGWLDLTFDDGGLKGKKWAVLDNGVLWVYKDDGEQHNAAELVIPLHDAELQQHSSSGDVRDAIILVLLGTGIRVKRLTLRPPTDEEYHRWMAAMMEAAQLWHARRKMAFMAVLPAAATAEPTGPGSNCSVPTSISEGRRHVVQSLASFLVQVGELRTKTRRAVTRNQRHRSALSADLNLPRFLRRAIADAVEKIWRACGRAHASADYAIDGGENADPLGVYDAVLVIREAVDAFVAYCSLLRELQAMLRDGGGEAQTEDPLPFTPLRCLSSLRDALARLSALIRCPEEEARQRAALAAMDSTLQRCWTELSKRPLDQDLPCVWTSTPERSTTAASASTAQSDAGDSDGDRPGSPGTPCTPFKGSHSIRRLASKLQRDVARTSVRQARKRARTEGQALLPDQPLDDSLDRAADTLEMTVLTNASGSPDSNEDSTEAAGAKPETPSVLMRPPPPVPSSAPAAMRCGSLSTLNVNLVGHRRQWKDPELLRRRRLVCSAADFDKDGGEDSDNVYEAPDDEKVKDKAAVPTVRRLDREWDQDQDSVHSSDAERAEQRAASVREDLGVLDIPVTPATPNGGGRRALWCETMEVQRSGLLNRLNTAESALQEAKFEVLSSEESYLRSLDMLAHRIQTIDALQDPCLFSDQERDAVSKFLDAARACSMRFVSALRALWSLDVMLRGLCTLMHKEAMPGASLQQYVLIVSLQPRVASVLAKIGSLEASKLIPLLSLPAQRASRLPLLLAAILRRLDQRTSEAVICRAALDRLNQIVFECNEALRRAEQLERFTELGRILRVEKSSSRKLSWSERKNNVIGRAKSFFLKSNSRIGTKTGKILSSTSSMLHLA